MNGDDTVFLASRMGLFRNDDRGDHWSDMEIGRFSELTYARDVKVFPHDERALPGAFSQAVFTLLLQATRCTGIEGPGDAHNWR